MSNRLDQYYLVTIVRRTTETATVVVQAQDEATALDACRSGEVTDSLGDFGCSELTKDIEVTKIVECEPEDPRRQMAYRIDPEPLPPAPQPTKMEQHPELAVLRVYEVVVEDRQSVDTSVSIAARSAEEAEKAALELERRNKLSWSSPCRGIGVTSTEDLGSYDEEESEWEVVDGELRPTEY